MKALAHPEVVEYLNLHFVTSFQKVASFRIVNGKKVGGNVASYFTLPDGGVLHVLTGPVDAATLLHEARWVVETRKAAIMESQGTDAEYKAYWRQAHAERLTKEHGANQNFHRKTRHTVMQTSMPTPIDQFSFVGHNPNARVHQLLAHYPLISIGKAYKVVFEKILRERISTIPVNDGSQSETTLQWVIV